MAVNLSDINSIHQAITPFPAGNKLPRMLVGTDEFYDLVVNSDVFVDKSLMIMEILQDSGKVILITRPRRWGKSLNMNMLQKFFEIEMDQNGDCLPLEQRVNDKLFVGGRIDLGLASGRKKLLKQLQIAQHSDIISEYQGQFPVISINFKDVKGSSYQEIESGIRNQIIQLFANHYYLKRYLTKNIGLLDKAQKAKLERYFTEDLTKEDLKYSVRFLSELLFMHFGQKVYILIDEYDTPINSSYIKFGSRSEEFEQVLELFRGIFGSALKTNQYLEKGIITGILRVAKANLFSDLNNVSEYTLLDKKFAKFYGFTQVEVEDLLTKVPTKTDPEKIKDWYNGYTFGGEIIYNPWSIMQCLAREGELDHYWLDSGGTGLVDKALLSDEIQEDLQALIVGKGIIKKLYKQISLGELEEDEDIFYSLLVFAGYLNPYLADDNPEAPTYHLTLPNKEVRYIYIARVTKWVTRQLNIKMNEYDNFINLLLLQQIEKFGKRLQGYLLNSTSYHDLSKERDYHNLMGGLLAPLVSRYMIESNRESGHGRCDHILVPIVKGADTAIILEYKICTTSEELESAAKAGLKQIMDRQYDSKIKEYKHVKKIIKISMAFCGKEVVLQHQIDDVIS
ncbi:AAA family ATPase [Candidatus Tisiphia endosymbiont of Nemotelus uliginosus]|uniref:AAA family ATPase n=1 Tax=Candidatus Tisiphia endosymbiont of Nemotelus uliginosus TaxID=3077926 RepID=UPI0035C8F8A1